MKKILMLFAMFTGAFAVMIGASSCKKDDVCCEWTDDFEDSYKYCEDDDLPTGATWQLVQDAAEYYNGTCD